MLFRPVYLKGAKMQEAPIPMAKPPTPQIEITPPPPEPQEPEAIVEDLDRIPMLVCGNGIKAVFPKEATRDVLCGKVDYYLADENGITLLRRKHIFNALKLDKERIGRFGEYPCLGAHQRFLEKKPKERKGLGYRRRFLSPELVRKGIYVS